MSVDDLPLRPMTSAEVLDAAVGVQRLRPWRLLGCALLLAGLEQVALYPLRRAAMPQHHGYFPASAYFHAFEQRPGTLWLLIAVGMGTEAAVIALLGGVAGRSAIGVLLASLDHSGGERLGHADRERLGHAGGQRLGHAGGQRLGHAGGERTGRDDALGRLSLMRYAQLVMISVMVGAGAAASFVCGGAPWAFWFMFTGLAAPALVIDGGAAPARPAAQRGAAPGRRGTPAARRIGAFRALGRSMRIVGRANLRPGGLRLLGYLMWFILRLLVAALGVSAFVSLLGLTSGAWVTVIGYLIWTVVNAVTYASMACLDATIHLETRMRLEGLDISLGRAAHTRTPIASLLAAPR